ncbi:MAG: OstA-like protein [Prolixibacteraceae bacterium]
MIRKTMYTLSGKRLILFTLLTGFLAFSGKIDAQNKKKVEILHSDDLSYNANIVANAQRLLGHVNITVDGALMWCDSLYSYENNTIDAFGNVHIVRGDTLNMYADFINYNGNSKLAKARRNVKLIDNKMTLTTDSLDYSMLNDLASYMYSGTVQDSTNVLTSVVGLYYVNEKKAYFKTNVDGVTEDYKIKSDTLVYFTTTKKVMIEGPTHIFNEKDTLYAESGMYDSMKGYATLTKNPLIWNAKQKVKADSIYYNKHNGKGRAMGHANLEDFENRIIVRGNMVQYNDLTKIASSTDSAVLIQYSEQDSLYLHADILETMPDTIKAKKTGTDKIKASSKKLSENLAKTDTTASSPALKTPELETLLADTLATDSLKNQLVTPEIVATDSIPADTAKNARLVLAYHRVRFYRKDFQGKCDSLAYWSKDSTIQLYKDPVIWSDNNQITADYIEMINRTKDPDEIIMKNDAFIIAMEDDSLRFNQIKGKNMTGFVRNNQLYKIDVNGNGQSNYYARDKTGIIGLNKAESSNITIYMNKGKVKKIAFIKSPDGELKPLGELEDADKLLPGFKWQAEIRPKNKEDIFNYPEEKETTLPDQKNQVPAKKEIE